MCHTNQTPSIVILAIITRLRRRRWIRIAIITLWPVSQLHHPKYNQREERSNKVLFRGPPILLLNCLFHGHFFTTLLNRKIISGIWLCNINFINDELPITKLNSIRQQNIGETITGSNYDFWGSCWNPHCRHYERCEKSNQIVNRVLVWVDSEIKERKLFCTFKSICKQAWEVLQGFSITLSKTVF